jgi:AcrR family transcriptional regulator
MAPTTRLDRATIVAAASELLDRDGLDGLTMRRLATELGVAPMATYRHFADRAALVDALIDDTASRIEIPVPTGDWRLDLKAIARSLRNALLARPALIQVVVARPALGPAAILLAEAAYAVLVPTGFGPRTTDRAANLLFGYVLGFVALEAPRRFATAGSLYSSQDAVQAGYAAVDPASLPFTREVEPAASRFVDEAQFEWGLQAALDGIQARFPGD